MMIRMFYKYLIFLLICPVFIIAGIYGVRTSPTLPYSETPQKVYKLQYTKLGINIC